MTLGPDLDPEGRRLPIKIDEASNGEHAPLPLTAAERAANALAQERTARVARRLGLGRRAFLKSACGAAATLLAFNDAHAAAGDARGGRFAVPDEAAFEPAAADQVLTGDEFIVDMQTHCVDPSGDWAQGEDGQRWARVLTEVFGQGDGCARGSFDCYSARQLVKEVFLDSDTDVGVISALWGARGSNPTPIDYAAEAREIVDTMSGAQSRALIHGGVLPNAEGQIDFMEVQAREYNVNAWKLYPQWGPDGSGFFMDEPVGLRMLEKARSLGVPIVAAHRGLPLPFLDPTYSHPADIARVAPMFPDMTFLCYHSGFVPGVEEGPYDPDDPKGVDRLIKAWRENGPGPNQGNLYAELGSVWRHYMSKPDQAAHLMGKLLVHFGEDRICWGTDSIWYGSPQDQIQAFRTFEITPEFQDRFGYPPLTAQAKRKILGLNAARIHNLDPAVYRKTERQDPVGRLPHAYRDDPNPSFQTFGPTTRHAFMDLIGRRGGYPA